MFLLSWLNAGVYTVNSSAPVSHMKFAQILAVAAIAATFSVGAQEATTDHSSHHPAQAGSTEGATPQSEGEVRKIDLVQGKVTLRHGPLVNLDMPAMTMVFTMGDKKLLEGLKEGDKVQFSADRTDGGYVVTALQVAN